MKPTRKNPRPTREPSDGVREVLEAPTDVLREIGEDVARPAVIQSELDRLASGPKTVTVACKLPHGLILRLFKPQTRQEPVVGGGTREVTVHVPVSGVEVRINGNTVAEGVRPAFSILGMTDHRGRGYALTHNVDASFFAEWLKQNQQHPAVMEQLIWAYADDLSVRDKAKELDSLTNGMEPINPDGDSRLKGIKKADKPASAMA